VGETRRHRREQVIRINRKLEIVRKAAHEKKAADPVALNVAGACTFADLFFICSGQQKRQTQAIADAIHEGLKKQKVAPNHVEGYAAGEWILMDYGDLVVHIFNPERRDFFNLERLWGDLPRLEVSERPKKKRTSGSRRI
jgi:ribosome-associated protein